MGDDVMKALMRVAVLPVVLGLATEGWAAERTGPAVLAQNTPQVCTEVYQPVCGTDPSGRRVTYSNACFARAAQATDVKPGECPK
jgi:hypothetical protein